MPRHEQLYQYSKIKADNSQYNREQLSPQLTFSPSINKSFESERTRMNFFERQQIDCREREYKQKLVEEANATVNVRRKMTPAINTGMHPSRSDVGQTLYEQAFKNSKQLELAREASNDIYKRLSREEKILPASKRFVEEATEKRLQHLFELLDSDEDGLISANRINVEALEPLVCKILSPILLRLDENSDVSIDYETFYTMVIRFMKVTAV